MKVPIVIMASGRGTGFEAIRRGVELGLVDAEIRAVISDQADAPVLARARDAGIKALHLPVPRPVPGSRSLHEELILSELKSLSPYFLVLAGYMRIITPRLIEAFRSSRGYSR